jgi:hypothetical protein
VQEVSTRSSCQRIGADATEDAVAADACAEVVCTSTAREE